MSKDMNKEVVDFLQDIVRMDTTKAKTVEQKLVLKEARRLINKYAGRKSMEELIEEEFSDLDTSVVSIPGFPDFDYQRDMEAIDNMIEDNSRTVKAFTDTVVNLIPLLVTLAAAA